MKSSYFSSAALLIAFSLCALTARAQDDFAGRFKKGDVMVSLGYGIPSSLRIYLNKRESNRDLSASGYGPVMLKLEYGLSNKLSISLNAFYAYSDVQWIQDARNPATGLQEPYRHGVDVWEVGAGLRANYYFLKKKNWNLYGGLGAGLGHIEVETYSFAPKERIYVNHVFPITWNYEGTIGARYFVAQNFALYTEIGIGQSWNLYNYYYIPAAFAQFGISLNF